MVTANNIGCRLDERVGTAVLRRRARVLDLYSSPHSTILPFLLPPYHRLLPLTATTILALYLCYCSGLPQPLFNSTMLNTYTKA